MTCNTRNLGCSVHELIDKPELLSRQMEKLNYQLGYTGKWHLGGAMSEEYYTFMDKGKSSLPQDIGFEGMNVPGHGDGGYIASEYTNYLKENGLTLKVEQTDRAGLIGRHGIIEGDEKVTVPYFLANHTMEMMDQFSEKQEPFFITHNFWGPHEPYFVPQKYYDLYKDVEIPAWENYDWESEDPGAPWRSKVNPGGQTPWAVWEEVLRHYYAFATLIDEQIGRMIAHLESKGLMENTIIIFTSDHGETIGSHGGLTDKGFHHFEETNHIPLIFNLPEDYLSETGRKPGARVDTVVSHLDLFPTFLELGGSRLQEGEIPRLDGVSLLPLLKGDKSSHPNEAFTQFYGVNQLMTTMFTLRKGPLKFGWNACGRDELYDLDRDPHEMTNLLDHPDYRERLGGLKRRMYDWLKETHNPVRDYWDKKVIQEQDWV
jgi:arylsulfatase A-like enzyme